MPFWQQIVNLNKGNEPFGGLALYLKAYDIENKITKIIDSEQKANYHSSLDDSYVFAQRWIRKEGQMRINLQPNEAVGMWADAWLQSRRFPSPAGPHHASRPRHRYIAERTLKSYTQYARALTGFFACTPMNEITLDHLREYQEARASCAGPNKINQEIGLLIQVLKCAGLWSTEREAAYEPLQYEAGEIPRALSSEEQDCFLSAASSQERWRVIYCYALVVLNTTSSSYEMRGLRLGDVCRGDGMIYVRWGKNKYRVRSVPLLDDGQWAITQLVERARALGARDPQHFLFPLRIGTGVWDAGRSISDWGLVKPWKEVREAAGLPWFQINALRHTALTRYAEAGTPIEIMRAYAGHLSEKMTRHYIQIGEATKRRYATLATQRKPGPVKVTQSWIQSAPSIWGVAKT